MSSWPFDRKMLATFLGLAVLLVVMTVISVNTFQSLARTQHAIVETDTRNLLLSDELARLQERRLSEVRAFFLTREPEHRRNERRATREFADTLDSLVAASAGNMAVSGTLQKIADANADFGKLTQRAFNESPAKAGWILRTLIRPKRIDLERSLDDLRASLRSGLERTHHEFQEKTEASTRTIVGMAVGKLLILTILGALLLRIARHEQASHARAKQARDTLQGTERRAAFLAQTGKIVTESADPKTALPRVASLAVDWLCDLCVIELTEGSGLLRPAAVAISSGRREALLTSLHADLPQGLGSLFSSSEILESGRPILHSKVADPKLVSLGIHSFLAVPLRARNRVLGVLLLCRMDREDRPYDDQMLQFAQEVSHQIALAIDNARLLQQAEEGLRMREELLSTVAHDLKNPLTSIRMNTEMLLNKKLQGDGASSAKMVSTIQDSAKGMEQLIHDLLDLTKIESGRIALDRRPHDAEVLLSDCIKLLSPQAQARSIELHMEVRPGECVADCDRNRVVQILSNLVGNAIKFTGKGGRVRLEAQATGEGIRFSVIDNGPGIPADTLPHVFDRYWQAHRTGTGSAGLGLSIARGIVEAHGGRIWVESALHIGSRFFFTLPEARKQQRAKAA